MMGVLNIAHVSFYMLEAYFSYTMFKVVENFWLAKEVESRF
jgi:branched-subunit amino acid ABC-type transport system permease component